VVRVPGALTDGDARQRLGATALADLAPLELHRVHGGDGSTFAVRGRPAPGTADRAAARIAGALEDTPGKARVLGVTAMGSAVGDTARRDTGRALVLSCAGLLLYMWARFELRPGLGALAALVHDTAAVAGALALTGTEVDVGVVAALLTVLGYSLNDSIVILDRLRENRDRARGAPLGALVDLSVRQCLARTLMTGVTVLLCLGAMGLIGPEPLRGFVLTMTVGVVAGTLSTLTIVCPLVASAAPRSIHSAP
jgi:preprotein translocase SecF subunit